MSVTNLLKAVKTRGIDLWFEGERLRFRAPKDALTAEQRAELSARRTEILAQLRTDAVGQKKTYPLSFSQRSLWFLHQQAPESSAYNIALALRIVSDVNVAAMRQALQALVDRHAALRTSYDFVDGALSQLVAGTSPAEFVVNSVPGLNDDDLRVMVEGEYRRPFDLKRGPVFRASLYTRGPADHVLLLTFHHIAIDGWSLLLLTEELSKFYGEATGGAPADLPRPELQYSDYANWQQRTLSGPEGDRLWSYWREKLASPRERLDLPTDHPRPAIQSLRGASLPFQFDSGLTQRVKDLARQEGTTIFVVLLASFQVFLSRLTGVNDVIVGTPTFGRSNDAFMRVVGDFVNSVPIRGRLNTAMTFRDLVGQLRQTVVEALDVQEFPLPLLVERLQPKREPGHSPLFDTFFILQRFDQFRHIEALLESDGSEDPIEFGGLSLKGFPIYQQQGQFDLALQLVERGGAFRGAFTYCTDLFEEATIRAFVVDYLALVEALVSKPTAALEAGPAEGRAAASDNEISPLTAQERQKVIVQFNATALEVDQATVAAQFERQVALSPEACAIRFEDAELSYGELNRRANQLARHLRSLGIGPGALVGVCLERSLHLVIALLAVQKAGAAYVPLDPNLPSERLGFMLTDSGVTMLVIAGEMADGLDLPQGVHLLDLAAEAATLDGLDAANLAAVAGPHDLAYVIYTSGSTGRPKGVAISHGALSNFLGAMKREPGLAATDVLAAVTTVSFDIAGLELYLPLLVGARIELISRKTASDGAALAQRLSESGATVLQATPVTWRQLVDADWRGRPGFRALCGGEALSRDLADAVLQRVQELWNLYGPTETTIWSTAERVERGGPISIGRPIANTQVYILDSAGNPSAVGIPGEIWIGGAGVAMGYHRRPELTAERFVPDRFSAQPGARLYRTGDLGRWGANGRLYHLGRLDDQVKIRGFRIEPGEIETVLREHPAVRQAIIIASKTGPETHRLVAYIVYQAGEDLTVSEVRGYLRQKLPDYMVPSLVVTLDSVPLTPNGKVDRGALPDPFKNARLTANHEPPAPGLEQVIAGIWRDLLKVDRIGANDNFFELGGHSLLSVGIATAIEKQTGRLIDPRSLFFQSLRQVAAGAKRPDEGGGALGR